MTRSFRIVGAGVVAWACAVASFPVQVCAATLTEYHAPRHGTRLRPAAPAPAVPAAATIRPASDGSDQTDALQAALNALQAGQTLILAPGRYTVSRSLSVAMSGVVVSGYGATLVATNPSDQTIVMSGTGSTLVGVTLIGTGTTRLTIPASTKVEVTGTGVQVLGVTIQGGAGAGIFVFGGSNVAIVGNTVSATLADGIHTTYGSTNVLVQGNTVTGTGDDMISVVSYLGDGRVSNNVSIDHNAVSGNYWGRGISVVGGQAVTISNNTVAGVQKAAGILVAQEDGWRTYGVSNVVIDSNVVTNIQNSNVNNGLQPTQQGALELDTWSGTVSYVKITRNRVTGSGYSGFRALGNVCEFEVEGNTFASIAGTAVSLLSSGCTASQIVASGNTLDGVALVQPVGASSSGTIAAAGAATTAMPQVRTGLMQSSGSAAPAIGAAR
ncbi:right-handed parallel beta-helix repeat-containing protein [Burkholderia cepacia]|uniref:right-handed parallel beta-helix repeat-containing protein n=1 Tax=Burkholderia cepacia TaxID=292 RepID=UPI00249F2041|nr:right-handed parallel beta-helix repeat-containing protein [Burkholderia cepacia]WGY71251.1 right-handed parallel beta-helix repeat-containing protein [Burkholderia cepacia]